VTQVLVWFEFLWTGQGTVTLLATDDMTNDQSGVALSVFNGHVRNLYTVGRF
jgi:hypothetical protein